MQVKVLSIYEVLMALGYVWDGYSGAVTPPFTTSEGWLEKFKNQNNMHSVTQSVEAALAYKEADEIYLLVLRKITADGGYTVQQMVSADKTGLY